TRSDGSSLPRSFGPICSRASSRRQERKGSSLWGSRTRLLVTSRAPVAERTAASMKWPRTKSKTAASRLGELPEQVDHFDRGDGRLEALVAGLGAGAVEGLFQRVAGKDAEHDRHARAQGGMGDAAHGTAGDMVVVVGVAADDGPQADDRGVALARGQSL